MSQQKVWDYYQGEGIDAFAGSVPRLRFLLQLAQRLLGKDRRRLLNIGTGNGWIEVAGKNIGWQTASLDPSRIAITAIVRHAIPGAVGVIESMPHSNESFDLIICSEVLEHLTDAQLQPGLVEIARILMPGGYLIGTVPFNETLANGRVICPDCGAQFHRWGHHQSFDRSRITTLLTQASLNVLDLQVRAFPYFPERSIASEAKAAVVRAIGRFGVPSAFPSLIFVARRNNSNVQ